MPTFPDGANSNCHCWLVKCNKNGMVHVVQFTMLPENQKNLAAFLVLLEVREFQKINGNLHVKCIKKLFVQSKNDVVIIVLSFSTGTTQQKSSQH